MYRLCSGLPVRCVHVLHLIVTANSSHFPKPHSLIGFYEGAGLFAGRL
jgi:hypothetical protein